MSTSADTQPDPSSMPPATLALFKRLSRIDTISAFTLIGGTALAINELHRRSEDLDFVTTDKRLDRMAIAGIIDALREQGCQVSLQDNPVQRHEFEESGLNIDDYHRDYVVDGVKLTFFTAEKETACALDRLEATAFGAIHVATTETLFRTKAILLTSRATKRDIFDLHFLLFQKKYTIDALIGVVRECHPTYPYETVRSRLLDTAFRMTDPGYDALVDRDITIEALREDIRTLINQYEIAWTQQQLEEQERSR